MPTPRAPPPQKTEANPLEPPHPPQNPQEFGEQGQASAAVACPGMWLSCRSHSRWPSRCPWVSPRAPGSKLVCDLPLWHPASPLAGAIKLAALSLQPRLCSTLAASPSSAAACYHPALFISSKARHIPQHSFQKGRRGTRAGRCPAPNRLFPTASPPAERELTPLEGGAAAVRKHRHSQHEEKNPGWAFRAPCNPKTSI